MSHFTLACENLTVFKIKKAQREKKKKEILAELGKKHTLFYVLMACVQAAAEIHGCAALKQKHRASHWHRAEISILVHGSDFTFTPALSCRLHNVKRLRTRVEKESSVLNRPTGPSHYQVLNSNQSARSPSSDPSAIHAGSAAR